MKLQTKWLVLASITLLLALASCNTAPTYSDYTHKPMNINVEGNSETLDKVQDLFNSKDYETANTHLSRLAEYYVKYAEVQLYYGITFLELEQYPLAKVTFDKILRYKDSGFVDDAQWYLALMALKQNDTATCKTYLEQIPEDSDYYDKASDLLQKL